MWFLLSNTTLCKAVWQWLAAGRWFSQDTTVSPTNKTDRSDISEIFLKVALNTLALTPSSSILIYAIPLHQVIFPFCFVFQLL